MKTILEEFNKTNSTNYKLEVMKKYKEHPLVIEVFQKALDKVKWTYGITLKNINIPEEYLDFITLEEQLNHLEKLADRTYTGNAAIKFLEDILYQGTKDNAVVVQRIIDRDLKINFGKTGFNKIVKKEHKITKPPYQRCGIYSNKTKKKINYPALIQVKADGRFCAVGVHQGEVTFTSRSGEEQEFPVLKKEFKHFPDGVYIGELLVKGLTNRSEGNGLINSDNPPHNDIYIQLWDFVTLNEYSRPKDKKNKTIYKERYKNLKNIIPENNYIEIIETHVINSAKEAMEYVSKWMSDGLEGGILKDQNNIFLDHTSPTQLKLKLVIDAEVRVTGFIEGKKGTKREKTFGSLEFMNDEGTIKGSVSGFTDKQLKEINDNREKYINKVITVEFNDLTKGRDNNYWALSHPRFITFRDDKNETDTLTRVQEMKEMATELKD